MEYYQGGLCSIPAAGIRLLYCCLVTALLLMLFWSVVSSELPISIIYFDYQNNIRISKRGTEQVEKLYTSLESSGPVVAKGKCVEHANFSHLPDNLILAFLSTSTVVYASSATVRSERRMARALFPPCSGILGRRRIAHYARTREKLLPELDIAPTASHATKGYVHKYIPIQAGNGQRFILK